MTFPIINVLNSQLRWCAMVFIIAVCCSGCSLFKQVKILRAMNGGYLTNRHFADSIPYDKSSGWIILKARVPKDTNRFDFVFDTGGFCTVSNHVADRLDLKKVSRTISGDVNKSKGTVGIYRIPDLFIEQLHFRKTGVVGYDHPPAIECMANGGILGSPLIREAVWHIDLRKNKILVTDDVSKLNLGAATRRLPVIVDKFSRPYIMATIEGKQIKCLFDLGANQLLLMPETKVRQFTLGATSEMIGQGVVGAWGSVQDTLKFSTLYNVELFGTRYTSLPVIYSNKTNLPLIGNRILDYYAVTLDLKNETIYLEPYNDLDAYVYQSFGFDVEYINDRVYVSRLTGGSAAAKSGLRLGNEIISINDSPADYPDYCLFQKAVVPCFGKEKMTLEFTSGGVPIKVSLEKESYSE